MEPLQLIRLRHLRTFIEVARQSSIGQAAKVLSVTQPAVSKTISELEALLGTSLFDRNRRKLELTTLGKRFLSYAEAGLFNLRRGIEEIAEANAPTAAPILIGALPTVSARLLPEAIRLYNGETKGGTAMIVSGPNHYLIDQLRNGKVDIVIGRMGPPSDMLGLHFEHLYSERIVLVVRRGHPLLMEKIFKPASLSRYEIIMPTKESIIRPTVDRLLLIADLPRLQIVAETVSTSFGRSYTRGSDAIWIISEGAVLEDIANGDLAALPFDMTETLGPVGMTMHAERASSVNLDILMSKLRMVAATFG